MYDVVSIVHEPLSSNRNGGGATRHPQATHRLQAANDALADANTNMTNTTKALDAALMLLRNKETARPPAPGARSHEGSLVRRGSDYSIQYTMSRGTASRR